MFNRKPQEATDVEEAITSLLKEMQDHHGDSDEYTAMTTNLKVLVECRAIEDGIERPYRPSADTVALVAGNLLGIFAILSFEKLNVITSKSLSHVLKPKI